MQTVKSTCVTKTVSVRITICISSVRMTAAAGCLLHLYDVVTVGVGGQIVTGAHNIKVFADIAEHEVKFDDTMDMIVLPGGIPGTLNLEKNETVQKAIDFCVENDRYIGSICAAPSILGHKGILDGKNVTCYTGYDTQ